MTARASPSPAPEVELHPVDPDEILLPRDALTAADAIPGPGRNADSSPKEQP